MENQRKQKAGKLGSLAVAAIGWTAAGASLGIGYSSGFGIVHGIGAFGGTALGAEFMRKVL